MANGFSQSRCCTAMPRRHGMTPAQTRMFWLGLQSACRNLGYTNAADREAYRKAVMAEETGKRHLRDLDRTHDFDRCMARFAEDSGDYMLASKFAVADTQRMAYMVGAVCSQVMQLKGCTDGTMAVRDYIAGIIGQSHIRCGGDPRDAGYWLDMAPDSLVAIFAMLDTHRRRLLRRIAPSAEAFMGFDPAVSYAPKDGGGVVITKCYGRA